MRSRLRGCMLLAAAVAFGASAQSAPAATQTDTTTLQNAVHVGNAGSGIKEHLNALQLIANANGGTRSTGSPGHEASVLYVKSQLDPSYWTVDTQPFNADVFVPLAGPTLSATPPADPAWVADTDYAYMEFSGSGNLTDAPTAIIDFTEPTSTASASSAGCEEADYPAGADSLAGKVAVIQRGTCSFEEKAALADAHGAAAVIIFNEGTLGDPERNGLINGTAGREFDIPVFDATYLAGRYLVDHPTATVSLTASARTDHLETRNVIAETKTGRADRTIVSGAHLDSVPEGPGINDDGSGTATQIEVAQQMAILNIKPVNKVRFIWFAGEEQGLFGSDYYVSQLTKKGAASIQAMLDFDMLASPNYAELIYDGNGSEFPVSGPNGSGTIEAVFQKFFDKRGEYTERIPFDGRSDYDAFTAAGIPAGGIFTGAEEHKDAFEADPSRWGGVVAAGLAGQYDPCYHLACDDYSNINNDVLAIMSDAVAHSVLTFAQTQSAVNGTDQASSKSTKPYEWKGSHRVR